MTSPLILPDRFPIAVEVGHDREPDSVQYLLRQPLHQPPTQTTYVVNQEFLAQLVDAAVTRQWEKFIHKQPLDVRPTFAVAPQSEYYSAVIFPDGQVVHRSTSQNVWRLFENEETGRAFSVLVHEFTMHFEAPRSTDQTWQMELFYPSDAALQAAMQGMFPLEPMSGNETEFPVHATQSEPATLPIKECLEHPRAAST
ncbi:hypothetical protein DFH09DRAFT_1102286 [Mycena vulgaris]|nr:hypothetical protein DFH09DRAFT_1102286 [Mycena vulgaris]